MNTEDVQDFYQWVDLQIAHHEEMAELAEAQHNPGRLLYHLSAKNTLLEVSLKLTDTMKR